MLTATNIARLKPPTKGKYSWHADHLVPAFGIRVYTTGTKSWGLTRRWHGAKYPAFRRIADYPTVGLADARALARQILADPGALEPRVRRSDAPPANAFGVLASAFLNHGRTKRGRALRASTAREYRRALIVYAAGLHDRRVREIRRADVAALIRTVATERGTTTAARCRAALSRCFSWLLANDLVDANIVSGTETFSTPKRSRVLTDPEISALWAATEDGTDFGLIVRLLLWTGCRRSEAGGMRWSELADDGIWRVDGSRTKNHRPLVLPLARQALAALQAHPRGVGRDFVFGRGPGGFQAWRAKERLDRKLGFARSFDLHDLRRSVETRMAGLGIPKDHVNKVLNHAAGPITEAYDQWSYLPEKASALRLWADQLDRVAAITENVVAIRG